MATDPPIPAPAYRARRWWLWLTVPAVGVVSLLVGGVWLDRYLARKAWTDACAEADRLDPGWRWDDLTARPNPPDDRNAAVRIRDIRQAMPQHWPDWPAAVRPEDVPPPPAGEPAEDPLTALVDPLEQRRTDFARTLEEGISNLNPVQQLQPAQIAALRAVLAAAAEGVEKSRGLPDLPIGRLRERTRPLLNDLFPGSVQATREVAILLRLHATTLANDGQPDAALVESRRILIVARAAGAEPMLVDALVAMAIRTYAVATVQRVIAQCEPGPAALDQARRAFEAAVAEPLMLDALRGERAFVEDLVRSVDEGLLPDDPFTGDNPVPNITGNVTIDRWIHRLRGGTVWTKRHSAAILRFQTFLIEIAKGSPENLRVRADEIAVYLTGLSSQVQKATTGYDQMFNADRRSRALLASAAAALAAERYRRDHGQWPASLDELVAAKLLASVPTDPFNGEPLRFRRLADGLVFYSVGQDGTDDGGDVRLDPQVGGQPKDVGVRLWDAAHRRQPPPPP